MRRLAAIALVSCSGGPEQQKDQAAITYHVKFTAEPGVSTTVVFPMPTDATLGSLMALLHANEDAGTAGFSTTYVGEGIAIAGHGSVSADLVLAAVNGFDVGAGAPDAGLTMPVPDGGIADHYIDVNKNGEAAADVEFEYTATRNCGNGCGGKRSWKFSGQVGLAANPIQMDFVEEN